MLSIFQPEVSTLESQVGALQAQIAAHTERISLLNETEQLAGGSLEALKGAIQKVSALAPSALANLRAAVLNLFSGSDNSSEDGNGNTPVNPAPQSSDDGGLWSARAVSEEPLNGQSCEWASSLCCQLADAPQSSLQGQSVDLAQVALSRDGFKYIDDDAITITSEALKGQSVDMASVVSDAPEEMPYIDLIPVTHLVAYQRRQDGEIICCYLAGNNKNRLKDWGSWLCNQHSVGSGFEFREAKRMTAYKWELKIWGMSIKQIQRLAETDTAKTPPSRYHVASQPVAERLLAPEEVEPEVEAVLASVSETISLTIPSNDVEECLATEVKLEQEAQPEPQSFQVGDKVEVTSDRHGVELVGQSGIVTAGTAAGAAVNVGGTMRWFSVDEVALVESSAPRNAVDDLFLVVSAPAPTSTPAYNANPIGRGGAAANWKARQAAGIGVNLKDCGTGGIKTLAEWQQMEADQKALAASTANDEPDF